jgi:hypothetical protein
MLLDYALASRKSLTQIFLVHGEDRGAEPLMEKLKEADFHNTIYPELYKTVEL